MNVIKILLSVVLTVVLTLIFSPAASAEDIDFGQEQISEALPDNAREVLESEGITPDNSGALNLSFGGVLGEIWELFKSNVTKPFALLCSLC